MALETAPAAAAGDAPVTDDRYPVTRLWLGVVGRTWLWFLTGCLLVTLLPLAFGWQAFVVQSDSMYPKIRVGDVVLTSPVDDPRVLLGHVAAFDDPDVPGRVKTHRVTKVLRDGEMVTKGDANPTPDSAHITIDDVRGIGRLLVKFAGLPLVWVRTGEWLLLLGFLASILAAAWAVARDHEIDDPTWLPEDDDPGDGPDPSGEGDDGAGPTASGAPGIGRPPAMRLAWARFLRRLVPRAALIVGVVGLLTLPMAFGAFAATTTNGSNSWSVPNWSYTTEVNKLGPYLYWKLDETTGNTAADSSGNGRTGSYLTDGSSTYFTRGITGALVTDSPNLAVTQTNAASCLATTSTTAINAPAVLTEIAWFKAPSTYTSGGKLIGFEKPRTGVAAPSTGTYDRMLYMDGSGYVWFAVYNGAYFAVRSTATLNDGAWHMAAATLSAAGMNLYIDGSLVATNANNAGEATTGWWRAGCGNLGGWGNNWNGANNPGTNSATTANRPFLGSLDEVTVYTSALTASDLAFLYWIR